MLSIELGTWKDSGRSLSLIWTYLNDWVKYYTCFLNAWIYGYPWSLQLALSSFQKGWLSVWKNAWVSDSSANTASVANTWVNCPYISGCLWQTSAAVWWQTSAQACVVAAKKWHKQERKNIWNVTRCRDSRTTKSTETREGWSHKTIKYTTPYISFFDIRVIWKKIPVGGLYT